MENIIFCDVENKMANRKPLNMIRYYIRDYIRLDIRDFCFTEEWVTDTCYRKISLIGFWPKSLKNNFEGVQF